VPEPEQVLRNVRSILVVDWPSEDVPNALAKAGYSVAVHGGPEPDNYLAYEMVDGDIRVRRTGAPPAEVDLVYAYRPIDELPAIAAAGVALGASTLWLQSGRTSDGGEDPLGCSLPPEEARRARAIVDKAGLAYLDRPYIVDAVRDLGSDGHGTT